MKLISKLSTLLTIFLIFSGCAAKEIKPEPPEPIIIEKVYIYEKCSKSVSPEYRKLESSSHIGSAYNVNTLIDNLTFMGDYVKSLELTISCYEHQTKEIEK